VSAGVRNLDGILDGRGRSVGRVHGRTRRSAGPPGWPCRLNTDHAHLAWPGPWPAVAVVSGRCLAARRRSRHVRGGYRRGPLSVRAGSRWAVGSWTPVQGVRPPWTPAWPPSPACPRVADTCRPDGSRSGSSGRSIRRLLNAARLPLAPTRYNFLYSSSRPALRAACGRPPARRRNDGHRGIGLTLQDGGAEATRRVAGHTWGMSHRRTAVTRG
jgi:hypothetical protein